MNVTSDVFYVADYRKYVKLLTFPASIHVHHILDQVLIIYHGGMAASGYHVNPNNSTPILVRDMCIAVTWLLFAFKNSNLRAIDQFRIPHDR